MPIFKEVQKDARGYLIIILQEYDMNKNMNQEIGKLIKDFISNPANKLPLEELLPSLDKISKGYNKSPKDAFAEMLFSYISLINDDTCDSVIYAKKLINICNAQNNNNNSLKF